MGIIKTIQQKPLETRMRILWLIVGISFILLILIWILTSMLGRRAPGTVFPETNERIKDSQEHWKNVLPPAQKPLLKNQQ